MVVNDDPCCNSCKHRQTSIIGRVRRNANRALRLIYNTVRGRVNSASRIPSYLPSKKSLDRHGGRGLPRLSSSRVNRARASA